MKKDKDEWTKWIPLFVFAVILIVIYRILGNLAPIMNFIGELFSIISPFLIGILIVYFLYVPCVKLENLYNLLKEAEKSLDDEMQLVNAMVEAAREHIVFLLQQIEAMR